MNNDELGQGCAFVLGLIFIMLLPAIIIGALWLFQYVVFVVPAIGIALFVFVAIFMAGRSIKKGDTER